MDKLGNLDPRSLKSFGVAGLLGEKCHVFYCSLFNTHHIGRISDLLCARLRESGVDELQLRMGLLLDVFEASSLNLGKPGSAPATIECGLDEEKVAIGISFLIPEGIHFEPDEFLKRVIEGAPSGRFEEVAVRMKSASDRLLFRFDPSRRRFEAVALIAIDGKVSDQDRLVASTPELVLLAAEHEDTPSAQGYTELGDVDYARLLAEQEEKESKAAAQKSAGEALADRAQKAVDAKKHVKGKGPESEKESRFGAEPKEPDEESVRIKGNAEETEAQQARTFKGDEPESPSKLRDLTSQESSNAQVDSAGAIQMPGTGKGASVDEAEATQARAELAVSQATIADLRKKIAELEEQARTRQQERVKRESKAPSDELEQDHGPSKPRKRRSSDDEIVEGEEEESSFSPKKILKKLLSLGRKKHSSETEDEERIDETANERKHPPSEQEKLKEPEVTSDPVIASAEAESLVAESTKLENTVNRAQAEAAELKNEISNPKAKRWMDGLMAELISEKAKIQDTAKKLNLAFRAKELEFRNKERAHQDELRKKDEQLRQKTTALSRTKEQLNQVQANLERVKGHASASGEESYKQKYSMTQKLLSVTKDENQELASKVEELKSQIAALKARAAPAPSAELSALKTKFERAQKQVDELKRVNQQLLDRLETNKKEKTGASSGNVEELRKRLDTASKLAVAHQKEAQELQLLIDEMKNEQLRLKKELEIAQTALRAKTAA